MKKNKEEKRKENTSKNVKGVNNMINNIRELQEKLGRKVDIAFWNIDSKHVKVNNVAITLPINEWDLFRQVLSK